MARIKHHSALIFTSFIVLSVLAVLVWPNLNRRNRNRIPFPLQALVQAAEVNPWTRAVEKVKEDRGEPTGRQAKVEIPAEVRHYSDTRRFLAVQVAEWRQHKLRTPQDLVDLADMVSNGEMVTLKPVTESYILFGVGGNASRTPFTRFLNGKSIEIYNEAGLALELNRLSTERTALESSVTGLRKELAGVGKKERSRRAKLQTQISATERSIKALREEKDQLETAYNAQRRQEFFSAYDSLQSVSRSFPDRNFDLEKPSERRDLKVRLLSSLRPEAVKVLEEIAASYHEKFDRPLPITSLTRPDEYQLQLSKTNANATLIDTPPHSTGLAFDIYYKYMTAAEQAHVMDHLAELKDAGRIEVLRENRDHYHVFAFVDGARPTEDFITASLGHRAAAKAAAPVKAAKSVKSSKKKTVAKSSKKTTRRRR